MFQGKDPERVSLREVFRLLEKRLQLPDSFFDAEGQRSSDRRLPRAVRCQCKRLFSMKREWPPRVDGGGRRRALARRFAAASDRLTLPSSRVPFAAHGCGVDFDAEEAGLAPHR